MKNIVKFPLTMFWTATFLFQTSVSLACTCLDGGEFAKNSARYQGVVRAKVIGYGESHYIENVYKSIIVEVIDIVKGKLNHSKLELKGDLGSDCREYANAEKYQIGREFLFVIRNQEPIQELAGCGESSIFIDGNTVRGYKLTSDGYKPYSLSLDAMIKEMKIEAIKVSK